MRLHRISLAAAVVLTGLVGFSIHVNGDPQAPASTKPRATEGKDGKDGKEALAEANKWMQVKLHSSQEIFAAMTRGDAKSIETNARRMLVINVLEQWIADKPYMNQSEYEAQLNAFEYATKELVRTGHNNDMDGALDAYVLLSKSCVKCHQVLRDGQSKK